jgi:hypothetical protein
MFKWRSEIVEGSDGMKEIKFRAWDSEANIMVYSDHRTRKLYDVYYGFEMNESGLLECRWEGDFTESHVLDGGTLDNIMQYTGLHDKNGKEIYEYSELDGAYEVIFKDLKYSLRYITNNDVIDFHDYWRDKNGEIEVTREYTKV